MKNLLKMTERQKRWAAIACLIILAIACLIILAISAAYGVGYVVQAIGTTIWPQLSIAERATIIFSVGFCYSASNLALALKRISISQYTTTTQQEPTKTEPDIALHDFTYTDEGNQRTYKWRRGKDVVRVRIAYHKQLLPCIGNPFGGFHTNSAYAEDAIGVVKPEPGYGMFLEFTAVDKLGVSHNIIRAAIGLPQPE